MEPRSRFRRKGWYREKMEWKMEKNDENSNLLSSLPVDCLKATNCNANCLRTKRTMKTTSNYLPKKEYDPLVREKQPQIIWLEAKSTVVCLIMMNPKQSAQQQEHVILPDLYLSLWNFFVFSLTNKFWHILINFRILLTKFQQLQILQITKSKQLITKN